MNRINRRILQNKAGFLIILSALFFAAIISSCHAVKKEEPAVWQKYTYKDYNGYLYTSFKNQKMNGLLCADVAGIKGSLKISHDCTEAQYTTLKEKLSKNGADWLCETTSPDTADYPDLSMYLTFVISSDELHEIWKSLGLE